MDVETPDNLFSQYLKTKKLSSVICSSASETRPHCCDSLLFQVSEAKALPSTAEHLVSIPGIPFRDKE